MMKTAHPGHPEIPKPVPRPGLVSVTGVILPEVLGITDAHGHTWIEQVEGAAAGGPLLDNFQASVNELRLFKAAGGGSVVDCQPGGCGRNGNKLVELSWASGVYILACTGFHLKKYYPPDTPIWRWTPSQAADHFVHELREGLEETLETSLAARAGFIKVACEDFLSRSPLALLEGAAQASLMTGAAIEIHTEKGLDAEKIVAFFGNQGVKANRLVLCHIDKRPDLNLHKELAQEGLLLEYDTFFRPKYDPEQNGWPLLEKMLNEGLQNSVTLAADFAEASHWKSAGGEPGLAGFITELLPRVRAIAGSDEVVRKLFSTNIAGRLATSCSTFQ